MKMKILPARAAASFSLIVTVWLLGIVSAAAAEESKAALEIKSMTPNPPAELKAGDRLTVTVDYRNPEARSVQIWVRPYTRGKTTPGYGAHGSYTHKDTAGRIEGWFQFSQPAEVDEVRVEMVERANGPERKVLASISRPITATWTGTRTPALATQPATAPRAIESARPTEPLEIKFTALDGREVDLAKLRGKVVLIDFWATWCGPCIAELPRVLEAYKKFHEQGFEIIGISFDQDKEALEKMIKDRGMAWPQYFDGKGWKNDFGVKYNIHGIPAMWLVDKQGRLATTNARRDLAGQVKALLSGKPIAAASAASSPVAPAPAAPPILLPIATPVALKISDPDLRTSGVFGFPQGRAAVVCDTADLRLSIWSNNDFLYAQAILWKDDDAGLARREDGSTIGDYSKLMLDVDADGAATTDVDRTYLLNPWPSMRGLHYQICKGRGAWTTIKRDTKGRGAIRYVELPDGRKVRVDSYVIPLSEISLKASDKVRLSFSGNSTMPALTVQSAANESSGRLAPASYHDYILARGGELPLDSVPDGRKDPSLMPPRQRE
jgi:thiol-disulfide isomerase/thioredoxin